ncbi:MAG: DUF2935 domain-containing protein, partial [Eubacteriales bacterium]
LNRSEESSAGTALMQLNRDSYALTMQFRSYILGILRKIVTEGFYVHIKPVYLNNMVTMSEEYMYLLGQYIAGKKPRFEAIVQDIFWLPMMSAEASYIEDNVGVFQRDLKQKAHDFEADFSYFFMFAVELQGMLRIGDDNFQFAKQYRRDLLGKLNEFMRFVQRLIEMYQQNGLPGTISLLQMDSLHRKLCYYITQLAAVAEAPKPDCNPFSLRLSTI